MITVACVFRSGGDFQFEHVWELKKQIEKHLPERHHFRVLTEQSLAAGRHALPLLYNWPGWWSKLELFRPGMFEGPVLYFDLDTMVVGDLTSLASYRGRLAMLSDFQRPTAFQSGVMAWTPGPHTAYLFACFADSPARHMREFRGDGQFLNAFARDLKPECLQVLYPEQIVSFKSVVRPASFLTQPDRPVPSAARVVCFHGQPRPWQTKLWEQR